jgi:hypothetical protein
MKTRLLVLASALPLMGTAGHAADIQRPITKTPKLSDVAPVASWSGSYAGVQGGYGWGDPSAYVDPISIEQFPLQGPPPARWPNHSRCQRARRACLSAALPATTGNSKTWWRVSKPIFPGPTCAMTTIATSGTGTSTSRDPAAPQAGRRWKPAAMARHDPRTLKLRGRHGAAVCHRRLRIRKRRIHD